MAVLLRPLLPACLLLCLQSEMVVDAFSAAAAKVKKEPTMPKLGTCEDNNVALSSLFGKTASCDMPVIGPAFCGMDKAMADMFQLPPWTATIFTNVCRKTCKHACTKDPSIAASNQDDAAMAMAQQLGIYDQCPGVVAPRRAKKDSSIPEDAREGYDAMLKAQESCSCQHFTEMSKSKEMVCGYSDLSDLKEVYLKWTCSEMCSAVPLPLHNLLAAQQEDAPVPQGLHTEGAYASYAWILAQNLAQNVTEAAQNVTA